MQLNLFGKTTLEIKKENLLAEIMMLRSIKKKNWKLIRELEARLAALEDKQ